MCQISVNEFYGDHQSELNVSRVVMSVMPFCCSSWDWCAVPELLYRSTSSAVDCRTVGGTSPVFWVLRFLTSLEHERQCSSSTAARTYRFVLENLELNKGSIWLADSSEFSFKRRKRFGGPVIYGGPQQQTTAVFHFKCVAFVGHHKGCFISEQ